MEYLGKYTNPVALPDASRNKDYKWFLTLNRGIMYLIHTNCMGIGVGGMCLRTKRPIGEKRAYYLNQQNIDKIREQLDPLDPKTKTRQYDISWEKTDFQTKTLNGSKSKLLAYNYAPRTTAIDEGSLFEKSALVKKAKLLADPEHKKIASEIGYAPKEMIDVESPEDIEILDALGGIRLEAEIQLKNAVEHSLDDSNFKLTLQSMFLDDLFVDNKMIAAIEVDPHTGRPCVKYIDIANAFYAPTKDIANSNMPMGGYIEKMNIPTLRAHLIKQSQSNEGITKYADVEKEIQKICNLYKGRYGNNYGDNFGLGSLDFFQRHGYYNYDHFTVDVLTSWVIASDTRTYVKGVTEHGGFEVRKAKEKEEGENVIKNTTQNVYRSRWVVGTDYIFDYGLDDVIVREGAKGNKRAIVPMVVYSSPKSSLVDRIIPFIDEINKLTFRQRHLLNQMIPEPSMIIDIGRLHESITLGGIRYDMGENLEKFKKTGKLLINSKNEMGDIEYSNSKPIEFVNQPTVDQILKLGAVKASLVSELEAAIGDNAIANGGQTSAELLVGVTDAANQAVSNALSSEIMGYRQFITQIGKLLMRKYETMIQAGEEINGVFVSENVRKEYKLSKQLLSERAEFAFTMEMLPSNEEKQSLIAGINAAYQKGELSTSEMMLCSMYIINDDLKAAQYFMNKAEKKAAQLAHKRQLEITQGQAQAQGDSAVKAEAAKTDAQIAIDNNKAANEERLMRIKYELEGEMVGKNHTNALSLQNHTTENQMLAKAAQTNVEAELMPKNVAQGS